MGPRQIRRQWYLPVYILQTGFLSDNMQVADVLMALVVDGTLENVLGMVLCLCDGLEPEKLTVLAAIPEAPRSGLTTSTTTLPRRILM